jgi:hypothetical protein
MEMAADFETAAIAPALKYAFSPVHKRALGVAFGLTCSFVTALATIVQLLVAPDDDMPLELLSQFFYGYEVSWTGVLVGAFWAFIAGFVAGWFLAFMKNFFTALWMFGLRVKSSFTQPFLDHI